MKKEQSEESTHYENEIITKTGDREKIMNSGFDEYVSKPVHKQDLMMKIENLFN